MILSPLKIMNFQWFEIVVLYYDHQSSFMLTLDNIGCLFFSCLTDRQVIGLSWTQKTRPSLSFFLRERIVIEYSLHEKRYIHSFAEEAHWKWFRILHDFVDDYFSSHSIFKLRTCDFPLEITGQYFLLPRGASLVKYYLWQVQYDSCT